LSKKKASYVNKMA